MTKRLMRIVLRCDLEVEGGMGALMGVPMTAALVSGLRAQGVDCDRASVGSRNIMDVEQCSRGEKWPRKPRAKKARVT
jgi:hypothetical protein